MAAEHLVPAEICIGIVEGDGALPPGIKTELEAAAAMPLYTTPRSSRQFNYTSAGSRTIAPTRSSAATVPRWHRCLTHRLKRLGGGGGSPLGVLDPGGPSGGRGAEMPAEMFHAASAADSFSMGDETVQARGLVWPSSAPGWTTARAWGCRTMCCCGAAGHGLAWIPFG